ncbi:MAG: hypothetical protein II816_07420 [Elusimicrobia bacterium]|nr:hypothetical protein [Elusimicrobiota bacterium]
MLVGKRALKPKTVVIEINLETNYLNFYFECSLLLRATNYGCLFLRTSKLAIQIAVFILPNKYFLLDFKIIKGVVMINQNKKTAIVFAINDLYSFCLYVSIRSLIKNSPLLLDESDIIIYTYDISTKNKDTLKTLDNVKIIEYTFPLPIKQTKLIKAFSLASFARYECFNLLNKYEKVIYLDSDILVQKELLSIFNLIKNTGIGLIKEKTNVEMFSQRIGNYDLNKTMFNSGFIVLSNKLKEFIDLEKIVDFCYKATTKYSQYLLLPDQAIINYAIQHFNINPTKLEMIYNMPASLSSRILKKSVIIHSTGHRKFWNYYYFDEFYKYYTQWIKKGGTPIDYIRKDSKTYKYILKKLSLKKFIFFHLCPDMISKPIKAIRFFIKFLFKIKY